MTEQDIDVPEKPVCARPTCTSTELVKGLPFCEDDVRQIAKAVGEMPALHAQLGRSLAPSSGAGSEKVSGSREAPLPLRVEVMALQQVIVRSFIDWEDSLRRFLGFTPAGRQLLWTVSVFPGPRIAYQGYDSEAAIQEAGRYGDNASLTSSKAAEPVRRDAVNHPDEFLQLVHAAGFVGTAINQLLAMPAADYTGVEILDLRRDALAVLGLTSGDVALPVPCPNCAKRALVRRDGTDVVLCDKRRGGCGEQRDNLHQLVRIAISEMHDLLLDTTRLAQLLNVGESTVRGWRDRGHLNATGQDPRNGRPLYRASDGLEVLKHLDEAKRNQPRRKDQPA